MTIQDFKSSLKDSTPMAEMSELLKALWYDAKGNWESAHETAQEISTYDGSWIHAYLHRKEGDISNASYWYARAGRELPVITLHEEWENILNELINR
jgi:hypothetical protein